jgi:hypothetical protein
MKEARPEVPLRPRRVGTSGPTPGARDRRKRNFTPASIERGIPGDHIAGRDIVDDHRTRTNDGVVADLDRTQQDRVDPISTSFPMRGQSAGPFFIPIVVSGEGHNCFLAPQLMNHQARSMVKSETRPIFDFRFNSMPSVHST